MRTDTPLSWSVVIPVKVLAQAKSRLSGLADADRAAMALAMAADTVSAAVACPAIGAGIVVSDDPAVRTEAPAPGAQVLPHLPGARLHHTLAPGPSHAAPRPPAPRPAA